MSAAGEARAPRALRRAMAGRPTAIVCEPASVEEAAP